MMTGLLGLVEHGYRQVFQGNPALALGVEQNLVAAEAELAAALAGFEEHRRAEEHPVQSLLAAQLVEGVGGAEGALLPLLGEFRAVHQALAFAAAVKVPVLANITEFGATPLFTTDELASADVSLVLYPLSAFRAMNKAAENVYTAIRRDGTQKNVIDTMQTRMELYDRIDYHSFEQKLDALFAQKKNA